MRKTQFALAAVALIASTAAMADGASIYGTIDASATKQTGTKAAFDGTGNWAGSIMGLKGSEEIEGGLKVSYTLEMGLNAGDGTQANGGTAAGAVFNRQTNVSVAGAFGSVKLGQQLSPYIAAALNSIANNNESFYVPMLILSSSSTTTFSGVNGAAAVSGNNGFFISNAISYTTPSVNGISASYLTQLSGTDANKYQAISANYAAGDISVAAGWQDYTNMYKSYTVNAAYTMGELRVGAGYIGHTNETEAKINTYTLGGSYAVAPNTSLSLQYAVNDMANAASILNAGLHYSLSKTAALYATVGQGKNGAASLYSTRAGYLANSAGTTTTSYAVGMIKSF